MLLATAWADETIVPTSLDVSLQAELRMAERDGKVVSYRYTPAQRFAQGQELYYTVHIRNAGTLAARDAVVIQPIPANTRYLAHSATGAGASISFSVDGGRSFAAAEALKLPHSSRRAVPTDYTHIRWQLRHPLEPSAVVLARFRVVFD